MISAKLFSRPVALLDFRRPFHREQAVGAQRLAAVEDEVVLAARRLLGGGDGHGQIQRVAGLRGILHVAAEQGEVLVEQRQLELRAADDAADAVLKHLFLVHAVDGYGGHAGAQRAEHLEESTAGQLGAGGADNGFVDAVPQAVRKVGRFASEIVHEGLLS